MRPTSRRLSVRILRVAAGIVVCFLGLGTAAAGQGREDFLLAHEDAVYRDAEGIEARTNVLFRVMDRRLTVLEYHHREDVKAQWAEKLDRDKWLGDLAEDPDTRLLDEYQRVLRMVLAVIDDQFAWNHGPTMESALRNLKKRGQAFLTRITALQASWKPDAEAGAGLERARDLTQRAINGAEKGLTQLKPRE